MNQVNGVLSLSPEVYSLIMFDGHPVTLHGITTSILQFYSYKAINGDGINVLDQTNASNQIIAGKNAANIYGLQIGHQYEFYSAISQGFATFTIVGIVSFQSSLDNELFTSINSAQFFRPTSSQSDLSLIRVKFDPNIITKNQFEELLQQQFKVTVQLLSQISNLFSFNQSLISIYTTNGIFVGQNRTGMDGKIIFYLPIGKYDFYVTFQSITESISEIILADRQINITLQDRGFIQSGISTLSSNLQKNTYKIVSVNSQSTANLTIKTFYGDENVVCDYLQVIMPNGYSFNLRNSSMYNLTNFPIGQYQFIGYYNDTSTNIDYTLNHTDQLFINFTILVRIKTITPNGTNISGVSCSIFDYRTNNTMNFPVCPSYLYLEKSLYKFSFTDPTYGNTTLDYALSGSTLEPTITSVLGNITTDFTFVDNNNQPLANQNIYGKIAPENTFKFLGTSNSQGNFNFTTFSGSNWLIMVNGSSLSRSFLFTPVNDSSERLQLDKSFNFQINVYNGSSIMKNVINNATVTITTLDGKTFFQYTNTSGIAIFNFTEEQVLQVTINDLTFTQSTIVSTLNQKLLNISLGNTAVVIYVESKSATPLPNVNIDVVSQHGTQTYKTNNDGKFLLTFPIETTYNVDNQAFFSELNQVLQYFGQTNALKYAYLLRIHLDPFEQDVLIPKGNSASYTSLDVQFPVNTYVDLQVHDLLGKVLNTSVVMLESTTSSIQYYGVSDPLGVVRIFDVPSGSYHVTIKFNGLSFNQEININTIDTQYEIDLNIISTEYPLTNLQTNIMAFSGKQFIDNFYSTTFSFFFEISIVLVVLAITILILLVSSTMLFIIENHYPEIFLLRIIGASVGQISLYMIFQIQGAIVVSSIVGLLLGTALTSIIPSFQNIEALGFVIQPKLSIEFFMVSLITINILTLLVLIHTLLKIDWKHPLEIDMLIKQREHEN